MATRKAVVAQRGDGKSISADEKIARLLAMLLVKDVESKTDKVQLLRTAGFDIAETAAMLGISPNHVMVAAYQGRKRAGAQTSKKRARKNT